MNANRIFRTALVWGAYLSIAIAIVGGGIGFMIDGSRGLVSALVGTALALLFLAITIVSILIANRFHASPLYVPIFFGTVMGGWIVKFAVFLIAAFSLKDQPWIDPKIMFLCMIVGILGTLVLDCIVVARGRLPYASDVTLPGEQTNGSKEA